MSAVPNKYQPTQRLINDPKRLYELYVEEDMTIREIADKKATVSRTRVGDALKEYGITNDETNNSRGRDPPPKDSGGGVTWSRLQTMDG
jgi:hypothetical protein